MTSKDSKLLIHIGLPKAASTTLQRRIFARKDLGFNLVDSRIYKDVPLNTITDLIAKNDLAFDPCEIHQNILSFIKNLNSPDLIHIISQERLIGLPDLGQYHGKSVADKLSKICPYAKVLIVLREQRNFVLSCYNQRVRGGSNMTLDRFIGRRDCSDNGYPAIMDIDFLNYCHIVEYYNKLFGKENVVVLVFEELVENFSKGIDKIHESFGLKIQYKFENNYSVNKGEGMLTVSMLRFINTFTGEPHAFGPRKQSVMWNLSSLTKKFCEVAIPRRLHERKRQKYQSIIDSFYNGKFVESNRKLESLIGENLRRYGYM